MEKEFVPYEQALSLKELGFNEPCFGYYIELRNPQEGILTIDKCENNNYGLLAPTFSQTFRWFRDNHNIDGYVQRCGQGYSYQIYIKFGTLENESIPSKGWFDTVEKAEPALLKKIIETLKK